MSTSNLNPPRDLSALQAEWTEALQHLPTLQESGNKKIPAFFFAHGGPTLLRAARGFETPLGIFQTLARFLKDFGPKLLEKCHPEAIVIFSAHWESDGEALVTDYGDSNPLLYDYFGPNKEACRTSKH